MPSNWLLPGRPQGEDEVVREGSRDLADFYLVDVHSRFNLGKKPYVTMGTEDPFAKARHRERNFSELFHDRLETFQLACQIGHTSPVCAAEPRGCPR